MPVLSIQTPRSQVSLQSERLVVITPEQDTSKTEVPSALVGTDRRAVHDIANLKTEVPLAELERVVLARGVQVSTAALCELLLRQIPVTFLEWNGRFLGSFEPPSPPRGASRLLQYQLATNPAGCLVIAAKLVHAKIANGRRLLQRLEANHHRLDATVMDALEAREREAVRAPDLAVLRGTEGAAAALFFESWARFLPSEFPFGQRSTRPPKNPVNACLSYLSALVHGELLTACVTRGLDPALGCLHQTGDDRWSLPLDLMEPFRPALMESLTLRLFSHRILQQRDFEGHDGGVWLNLQGRRTLIQHYEQRVQREFMSEHTGCRTTLRQQLQNAAVQLKMALGQPDSYVPFRVN